MNSLGNKYKEIKFVFYFWMINNRMIDFVFFYFIVWEVSFINFYVF